MKRKLLLISALIASSFGAIAQNWHIQNSGFSVASRGINDFHVLDSNVVWAVAYNGTNTAAYIREFTVTRDGGATWLPGNITATGLTAVYGLANISAVDADTAYASIFPTTANITQQGVWKTTNGGINWVKVTPGAFSNSASFLNVVHMFDAQNGVAMGDPANGYFEMYTTSNYGNTWTRVPQSAGLAPLNAQEYGTVGYFSALDSSVWYATNYGRVLVSHDLGLTWEAGVTPYSGISGAAIPSLSFKDKMNGSAIITDGSVGTFDAIISTTDGGLTWDTLTTRPTGNVYSRNGIAYAGNDTWFVSSANSTNGGFGSAYTEDGGATWANIDKLQHTCIAFNDINNGWSGGFNTSAVEGGIFKWGSVRQPVGISKTKANANMLSVYPNPSNGSFYINAKVSGKSSVRVSDITGRVVLTKEFNTQSLLISSLDLSAEAKGIYIVEFTNGGNVSTQRVVLQ